VAYFAFCEKSSREKVDGQAEKKTAEPKIIRPDDIDPHHNWKRPLHAPGHTQVDFEERINFRRLHDYRLAARARRARGFGPGCAAFVRSTQYPLYDEHRYRRMGRATSSRATRCLRARATRTSGISGSAAKHHRLYAPWLHVDHCKAGLLGLRGAVGSDITLFREAAREIKAILDAEGVGTCRSALTWSSRRCCSRLQKLGIEVRDGQQVMLQAREVKNIDELDALNMASAMVDGVYQDIAEALKPGVKESEIVALATSRLYQMGSDCVEAINSISGERCSPHPHNFTDRLIRRATRPSSTSSSRSWLSHLLLPDVQRGRATAPQRTAYRKAREWMDKAIGP